MERTLPPKTLLTMLLAFFPLLAVLVQLASAFSHPPSRRDSILSPLNDPFYTPPKGWKKASNGDVLRTRKVDLAFLQIDEINYEAAYQILYRTTGAYENDPSTTVTTVIIPHNAKRDKLVNYMIYTDAAGAQCAPSYAMRKGGKIATDLALNYQQLLFSTLLEEGYIMTLPDHQGPTRAFAAGRLEGRMSLDGIRATLNYERIGLSKKSKVASFGYSGGAIASGWAAALQPSYAPEINAVGFAMGGTPANITSTVENLNDGLFSGFGIAGVVGLLYTYPKIMEWSKGKITKAGHQAIEFARNNCLVQTLLEYPFQKLLSDKFVLGGGELLYDPTIRSVIYDMVMGYKKSETPTVPVYMFHGQHDEVIPFNSAIKTGRDWAKHGADVYFEELTDVTMAHLTSELFNLPNVLFFVRDRMEGKSFSKGFTHKRTGNPLEDPGVPLKGLGSLVEAIQNIVGKEVGPGDAYIHSKIKHHAHRQ